MKIVRNEVSVNGFKNKIFGYSEFAILDNPENLNLLINRYFNQNKNVIFCTNHLNDNEPTMLYNAIRKNITSFRLPIISAKKDLELQRKKILNSLKNRKNVLLYPEITRYPTEKLINDLSGDIFYISSISECDIIPVVFETINGKNYMRIGDPFLYDKNATLLQNTRRLKAQMLSLAGTIITDHSTTLEDIKRADEQFELLAENWDKIPKNGRIKAIIEQYKVREKIKTQAKEEFNESHMNALERRDFVIVAYSDLDSDINPDLLYESVKQKRGY